MTHHSNPEPNRLREQVVWIVSLFLALAGTCAFVMPFAWAVFGTVARVLAGKKPTAPKFYFSWDSLPEFQALFSWQLILNHLIALLCAVLGVLSVFLLSRAFWWVYVVLWKAAWYKYASWQTERSRESSDPTDDVGGRMTSYGVSDEHILDAGGALVVVTASMYQPTTLPIQVKGREQWSLTPLPWVTWLKIDHRCDEFLAACRQGKQPEIQDFLDLDTRLANRMLSETLESLSSQVPHSAEATDEIPEVESAGRLALEDLPVEIQLRIEMLYDEFECDWREGLSPEIDAYLHVDEEPFRTILCGELDSLAQSLLDEQTAASQTRPTQPKN